LKEFSLQFAVHFSSLEHNQEGSSKKPPAGKLIAGENQAIPPSKFMPFSEISRNQMKTNMLRMYWPNLTPLNKALTSN
jgi:hypothetical protein